MNYPYRHWTIYLGLFLSALCLFTALRIEWFNAQPSTTKLPRPYSGKWRYAPDLMIERMAEFNYRDLHNLELETELTAAQWDEVIASAERMKQHSHLNNEFRGFLGSYGLLQYLLVPSLFFLGFYTGISSPQRNRLAILFILIAALCGFLMLHRNYVGSLGW